MLAELAEIADASGRPDLFARVERAERDAAGPFGFSGRQMRVGKYHHDEKVAAHECRVIDGNEAVSCVMSRLVSPAEIPQAMTDLCGQLRLIEVANPAGIFFRLAPLELANG